MTATLTRPSPEADCAPAAAPPGGQLLDVVIPVYNEQDDLERCVRRRHAHPIATFPYPFRITIAPRLSGHSDLAIGTRLAVDRRNSGRFGRRPGQPGQHPFRGIGRPARGGAVGPRAGHRGLAPNGGDIR